MFGVKIRWVIISILSRSPVTGLWGTVEIIMIGKNNQDSVDNVC